jgi:hypothetical protein
MTYERNDTCADHSSVLIEVFRKGVRKDRMLPIVLED